MHTFEKKSRFFLCEMSFKMHKIIFFQNILHFPTHGHPWDRIESDLHEKL